MRCLVTGARGLLGRELVTLLREHGDEVVSWDLPQHDITDVERTISAMHQVGPEVVFHLAAWTDVDGCENDKARAATVNFQGTWVVALGAAELKSRIVYLSTDYVFDGRASRPYRERDATAPLSVYGRTKLMGEQAVQRTCSRYYIVRTGWLYGRHGRSFVNTIRQKAASEQVLKVVNDQTGTPTWSRDICRPLLDIARSHHYGIYHLANAGQCTWFELAREVVRLTGAVCEVRAITSAELGLPAPRPAYSVLDNRGFQRRFGYQPRLWKEALEEYLAGTPTT